MKIFLVWHDLSLADSKIQGGLNMTGTNCDLFTHKSSRSYLNHLVFKLDRFCAHVRQSTQGISYKMVVRIWSCFCLCVREHVVFIC